MKHVLPFSVVLIVTLIAGAHAAEINVNPGDSIQAAVTAASAGDTISIAAGTYSEDSIVIDKQLIIQGAGSASTIIDGSGGTGDILVLRAGGLSATDRMVIRDLQLTGAAGHGIRAYKTGGLNLDHLTLDNVVATGNGSRGVEIHNDTVVSDMEITSCAFVSNGAQGLRTASNVIVDGMLIADSTFDGNTYGMYLQGTINDVTVLRSTFNNSVGGYGAYMTETGPLTNLTIEDCQFHNNVVGFMVWNLQDNADITIVNSSFRENDKWGVLIWGNTLTNVLVQDCTVQNNDALGGGYYGLDFYTYDEVMTSVEVHGSVITGHTVGGGVKNRNAVMTAIVDATYNWWGDASGPDHDTSWDYFGLEVTNPDGLGDGVTDYVLYSPWAGQGGLVTGGGTIWSKPGDFVLDPAAEGQANFGFVAKYKKGASVPDGNTNFVFSTGDLHFHSSEYDWLIVAGETAKFKGTGQVEGLGDGYKFMLWAGDGDPDTFRIKIWEEVGDVETVIYDNGSQDPITGGNILIHKEK